MENQIFFQSPIPEDRQPREEVIFAYLKHCQHPNDERYEWAGIIMTGVTFYTDHFQQWDLILELVERAPNDDQVLQDIAAGPIEGFLGRFDNQVIERVEREAAINDKFRRVLSGVWKHGMSDATWNRVRTIQKTANNPLPEAVSFEK